MNHPRPWRLGAVAAAIALAGTFASLQVQALGLGRVTVQSALGEPLRAEIDIPEINAEEAASLRASVASADAFKAAGLEYSAAVTNLQISLQRRPDGRSYLRLTSDRPVSEPFVDLILEARWASGRIVRDYTMLFDPPNLRAAAQPMPAPTAPMVSRPPAPVATLPPAPAPAPAAVPYSPPSPPPVTPAPAVRPIAPPPPPVAASRAASPGGETVTVKAGDTAGRIAAQTKPASVSLDQMLVALLRRNPDAFIDGNVNRLKAGAVLEVPGADQAEAVSAAEASRTIVAQSRDFNAFRRKLAESAPPTQTAGADRQATGQVQAKVEDKAPAAATPDKLTLSKGAVQGKAAAEEKIAQDRQAKEAAERVAELSKNIADLNKLGAPSTTSPAAAPPTPAAPASPAPGVAVPGPGALPGASPAPSAAVTPAAPASPAASASAPAADASATVAPAASAPAPAPAPVKKPVVVPPPPPPPPEPSLIDELLDNPLILAGGAALLLLLLGLAVYRARQRKDAVAVDSSFLESRLQPDSFFGASGGQ
ncbi:MAG: FimV/HubP family polar landmark protein, partial [Polaromonas sp.]|nr:FimV/HubP family polar landmark protein [Polaromonas sp.]